MNPGQGTDEKLVMAFTVTLWYAAWAQSAKVKLPPWHGAGQPKTGEAPAPGKTELVGTTAD